MFVYVILALGVLMQVEARAIDKDQANIDVCINEKKLDIHELLKVTFKGPTVIEDNPTFNILAGCLWEKAGIWTKDHQIDEEQLLNHIQMVAAGNMGGNAKDYTDLAKEIAEACKNEIGTTFGETSTKMQNCINTKTVKA